MDRMLDGSIFFSFDRSGYRRHQRTFDPSDLDRTMRGRVCLVTGANSGLGLAVSSGLAAREATVHMLCRNEERGSTARDAIVKETGNDNVFLHVVDVSSLKSVRDFAGRFTSPTVEALIHNAGVLPLGREFTQDGLELTVATHLVGPHLLNRVLLPKLRDARIVFVSSGGMYPKRLNVEAMLSNEGPYNGVDAYAMTKRGQVVLSALWSQELLDTGVTVNAMHPGWAATKSVEQSLPRFWRFMRNRLRTAVEGADTVLWLVVAEKVADQTGKFWFDRRSVPTHLVGWTREDDDERQKLWRFCEARAGTDGAIPE
jgi:NAD(P)-dependent dehydrogenase (short-subunit alcohol dehydrogenase family)